MSDQVKQTVKKVFEDLATSLETGRMESRIKIGLTIDGSELGTEVMKQAAYAIKQKNLFDLVLIGKDVDWAADFEHYSTTACQKDSAELMEELLDSGELQGCVTLHYNFPIGVSTVGKVVTPALGRELFIATTTGTTSSIRNEAMVLNAINGIAAAKACGIQQPTIGILNIEGAKTVERSLTTLQENGYELVFGESQREDGGKVLRGNDLLLGSVDVVVCDSLTGNLLMKFFSAYSSGGNYETVGAGYGPGIGRNYERNICIISRASGAPVIANALEYAYELAKGKLGKISQTEYQKADQAGLKQVCLELSTVPTSEVKEIEPPPKEIVTSEIAGIEIMELEDAVKVLWEADIYAESGMGCTGPIVLVNEKNLAAAQAELKTAKYL
ncbi:glycine/betaine reductase C [Enterococcus avium]|uniref:glycine/sarcosine/betaine reductase complex component C subunit alpha n=1 Tax=Enterococcus malodoratus TaxID=71451 RepID=UPI0008CDB6E5|nr:glycine/sarcosine/betaine reductase complex component C subunit alpha [Enterococcus malodoratus]BBM18663.1 glycine/betaine reductase C [Enterococcus avium]SET50294.1 Fatty acid synthesis protein [Enterococcus malodoratus]